MPPLPAHPIRLGDLTNRRPSPFAIRPNAATCADIAAELAITAVRKLDFKGTLTPSGKQDWVLNGHLGATVVQPCGITLAPVTTRLDETITRRYMADLPEDVGGEVEMPADDSIEELPATLDLGAVMVEALSLALPAFPRAPGAELGQHIHAGDGATPMTDDDARPFAGLGALRDALGRKDESDT